DSESDPYLFKNVHHQKIPHLQYSPVNPNMIFSCSYDGSIRCGDLENRVFSEVYVDKYSSCSYFDFLSPVSLIVGKKSGCIDVVDFRNGKSSAKSHECHGHLIETVSIHPINKHYFITAMHRTVSVWDLRKLQRKPVASITHPKNTTISAYFSPVTGNSILTTFCDHSLCLFDSSYLTVKLWLKTTVRHGNFTGQATWLPETDDVFMIGSEAQPGRIQILNDNMKNIYNFMDEDLSATAVNRFHPSKSVLAGSNPNGKVFVFVDSQ
ncbi:WD repeat-containing protein 76-like, partial [Stegodyphus dumicola]|uniref:WD repeat-containing protein 76-like n=1 Tax=Stegodyphus dumicola TaxID=202533 RepID=UPI0015A8B859